MEMQQKISLRKAITKDCDLLFNWRNEKACRENSLNTDEVPYETHCAWFEKRMNDKDTLIYICMLADQCVGQVRLDMEGTIGTISYSIDPNYRGQGIGVKMLECLEREPEVWERVSKLHAQVKVTNVASQFCFEKLGYKKECNEELCFYSKILSDRH